jgi:hypothetical protein
MALPRYRRYPAFAHSTHAGSVIGVIVAAAIAALVGLVVGGASVFAVLNAFTTPPRQAPVVMAQRQAPGTAGAVRTVGGSAPDLSAGLGSGPPAAANKPSEAVSTAAALPQPAEPSAQSQSMPVTSVSAPAQAVPVQEQAEDTNAKSGAVSANDSPPAKPVRMVQKRRGAAPALYDYSNGQSAGTALRGLNPPRSVRNLKAQGTQLGQASQQSAYARDRNRYYGDRYEDRDRERGGGFFAPFSDGNRGWND